MPDGAAFESITARVFSRFRPESSALLYSLAVLNHQQLLSLANTRLAPGGRDRRA